MNPHPGFLGSLTSGSLWAAAWTTIWLAVVAQLLGLVIGLVMAPLRRSRLAPLRWVSAAYVWFFRGSPELLQILAWYSVLPLVGVDLPVIAVGILGLGVNEGARMTEIVRGALSSVDSGQTDAARVLGLGPWATARWVVLPQAARLIIGPLGNQMNYMFKTTSLVAFIGIVELLRETQQAAQFTNAPLAVYLATATVYLAITSVWGALQRFVEQRVAAGKAAVGPGRVLARRRLSGLIEIPGAHL
ncbi:amino acid ABC transporter permease [Nakamurella endophytica]|uniref:ABC transporter permease n=1 Tax=Nakamurella endophytica TaxID=1748367 RepID=A0A917SVX8_9ACTN|nr:amino acid ABC transporter permease [Nakamurella endophytica]GGL98113.1 ABC transporter permease [Nakamurella endophytica]